MRNAFVNTILDAAGKRKDIHILTGDGGLGLFDKFQKEHPGQYQNMGIAEQNMTSFAAGLAMTGSKPFIYNIIPFGLYRCYEQVRNDICYHELPVTIIGVGSGLTYAPQGVTHYATEDLGIVQTLPNLVVISPADPVEAKEAAKFCLTATAPVYVRLAKKGEAPIHDDIPLDITKPQILNDGEGVAIVFHGSIANEVVESLKTLKEDGIYPLVMSIPMIQPIHKTVIDKLKSTRCVICVEEHDFYCGLGGILNRCGLNVVPMGLPRTFIHSIKDTAGMRKHFGIDAAKIVENVKGIYEAMKRG